MLRGLSEVKTMVTLWRNEFPQLSGTGDHSSHKAVSGTDSSASIYFNNLDGHFRGASISDQAILKFILNLTLTGECCHGPCLDLVRLSW